MIDKLREYIDELFKDAPSSKKTVEIKEEILQNLGEKYNDLRAEGKSEDAAYNIAVASIGDISELIDELKTTGEAKVVYYNDPNRLKDKQRSAAFVSVAVMLYILSIIPIFILGSITGVIIMFVFIAIATGLLIYNGMTRTGYKNTDDTIASEFKEWRESSSARKSAFASVSSALWAVTLVVYFLVSFGTGAWHITWLLFLIAIAINNMIKTFFDYRK